MKRATLFLVLVPLAWAVHSVGYADDLTDSIRDGLRRCERSAEEYQYTYVNDETSSVRVVPHRGGRFNTTITEVNYRMGISKVYAYELAMKGDGPEWAIMVECKPGVHCFRQERHTEEGPGRKKTDVGGFAAFCAMKSDAETVANGLARRYAR